MSTTKPIEGTKYDESKVRTDLLPTNPLMDIAKVLTFGARKYNDRNWEKGIAWNRVYGALQRHLFAWWNGQDLDPETGLSHLAHAGCCIVFLLEFEKTHRELDNRPNSARAKPETTTAPKTHNDLLDLLDRAMTEAKDTTDVHDVRRSRTQLPDTYRY